jgi:hypothetical protein
MAKAWLNVPDRGTQIKGEYSIVYERSKAVEMLKSNALEVMKAAENGYPTYTWEVIPSGNQFVVEGTIKQK